MTDEPVHLTAEDRDVLARGLRSMHGYCLDGLAACISSHNIAGATHALAHRAHLRRLLATIGRDDFDDTYRMTNLRLYAERHALELPWPDHKRS